MNERIRELAEQAGFENGHQDRNGNSLSGELEKFAELIVEDCLFKIRLEASQYLSPDWKDDLVNNIKEHFGVER